MREIKLPIINHPHVTMVWILKSESDPFKFLFVSFENEQITELSYVDLSEVEFSVHHNSNLRNHLSTESINNLKEFLCIK